MATTKEQNERLTQVGPGTPMGNLMRRYWQPIATTLDLNANPVRHVRALGEDLTLYRDRSGNYGLVAQRCPHRCVDLKHGIPEANGLRCAYHGWVFDATGQCIEQPFEDRVNPEADYKARVKITAYPVQALGDLVWAYFGPQPAPLLPRWDLLVREDLERAMEIAVLPCNWLQCMDNSVDPVHFEFLHARYGNYEREKLGIPPKMLPAEHIDIAFDVFRFGIMKRRLLKGDPLDSDDWTTGHPLLFPNGLAVGGENRQLTLQFRLPVDDVTTIHFHYRTAKSENPRPTTVRYLDIFEKDGSIVGDTIPKQDFTAWIGQGPISDRTGEHLTATDKGVILYHKLLVENMEKVARGEDPMGLIRDPAENEPYVAIPRENMNLSGFQVKDEGYFQQAREMATLR